jgi:sterol 3beta-glucosyltransferase
LQAPILDAFSEVVVPREACWGAWVHVTGYWFLDTPADWSPPQRLLQFLEAGPPPVFVGFGSMVAGEPHKVTRMVVHALHQAGQRGVIAADMLGPNPATVPDDVLAVEPLPHEWLFPRMAALVHHGGAGTTAAGLRAGCPSVLVPHFADQPFWARRVHQLGAGPRGIPRRQLSAHSLARAIRAATSDEQFRHRARALGQQIAGEDGVAHAVDALSRSIEA